MGDWAGHLLGGGGRERGFHGEERREDAVGIGEGWDGVWKGV